MISTGHSRQQPIGSCFNSVARQHREAHPPTRSSILSLFEH